MTPELQAQLKELLTVALPFLAFLVSYAIQRNAWPSRVNMLVASGTIILASVATVFIDQKLTGNLYGDMMAVLATATALQMETFRDLQKFLRNNFPVNSVPEAEPTPPSP